MASKSMLWRFYPIYLLIVMAALAGAAWYASHTVKTFYLQQTAQDLESRAYLFAGQIGPLPSPGKANELNDLCRDLGEQSATRITIILPGGTVLCDSEEDPARMENHANRPEIAAALTGRVGMSVRHSYTLDQAMMYVAIPLRYEDEITGVIRTSLPVTAVDQALSSVYLDILAGGLIVALFAALIGWIISRRISRPLAALKDGAQRFAQGNLDHRLDVQDLADFSDLAEVMNQMAERLEERINTVIHQRNEQGAVLSSMVEGVLAVDREDRLIKLNQAAAQMLGLSGDEEIGRTIQETIRNTALQQFVTGIMKSDRPLEDGLLLGENQDRHVQAHGTVLRGADGDAIGALVVLNDVTHLRHLEKVRQDFVANVSHELKTPITSIKGFVETLLSGALDDRKEAERFLKIVSKHSNRLNAIINDLLSLSKVEQGTERSAAIDLNQGCLQGVVKAAVQLCESRADLKNVTIRTACGESTSAMINARLLEQAVVNLLDNAIKYSEDGGTVTVACRLSGNEATLSVTDEGCGIPSEHLSRLFERFYRVDKARSRELGGTGLGLSIVKHIAQSHGGRIEVQSAVGKGSVFTIYLPAGSD